MSDNIKVFVRVRPLLPRELLHDEAIAEPEGKAVSVFRDGAGVKSSFDHVFGKQSSQEEIYSVAKGHLSGVLQGYNTTIFAYGQTGTGKTYTMLGEGKGDKHPDSLDEDGSPKMLSRRGIIPRAVDDLFEGIKANVARGVQTSVHLSYIEIYNERIHDLLEPYKKGWSRRDPLDMRQLKAGLELRENGPNGVHIPNITTVPVTAARDVLRLVAQGNQHRSVRLTEMNESSSRSHSILQLVVEQRTQAGDGGGSITRSKMNLVDLAGSERWAQDSEMQTARINEMTNINVSLSALASVIAALSTPNRPHIPYRDSKLTHLLQDSLGGNCRTAVIATLSPSVVSFDETVSTLKFADRARMISTAAVANSAADSSLAVEGKDKEISRLRGLLALYAEGGDVDALADLGARVGGLEEENRRLKAQLSRAQEASPKP